jgi:hypothetical protein
LNCSFFHDLTPGLCSELHRHRAHLAPIVDVSVVTAVDADREARTPPSLLLEDMERVMTTNVSRWPAVLGWTVLMSIVWALFVPKGLSAGTFTLLTLTGPLLLVSSWALWNAQRPSPSIRQIRATLESSGRARTDAEVSG